jgi:hypothetical protein
MPCLESQGVGKSLELRSVRLVEGLGDRTDEMQTPSPSSRNVSRMGNEHAEG